MFFRVNVDAIEKSRFSHLTARQIYRQLRDKARQEPPNATSGDDKYEFLFVAFYGVRNISEFNSFFDNSGGAIPTIYEHDFRKVNR